jgi:zinc protease
MTSAFVAPPAPGKPRPYRFPHTEWQELESGARVSVASFAKFPLVTVALFFRNAGASNDPPGREGLAQLTASMLLEGSALRTGAELSEHFESLGSSLTAAADWDGASLSFTVQPSRLAEAIAAVRDVVRAPAFHESELRRLQADHHAGRMQLVADPRGLADSAFTWSCYGDQVRYRRPLDGTLATTGSLGRSELADFWKTHYGPESLTVVAAGDVDLDRAVASAEMLVDGWTRSPSSRGLIVAARRSSKVGVALVEKPGAAQAELRIGHIGVPRGHPSYFSLTVMNAILGGLFSSRINLNLRERHGYTYGAFSGFDWRTGAGPWAVSTAVKSEVCGAAIREVLSEIARMRAEPVTSDELELASNYLVGVFPLRFETTSAVASALVSQAMFDLRDDYFDTYRERVAAVTPQNVLQAAKEHLHPDQLQIVAAGEPSVLRSELEAATGEQVKTLTPTEVEAAP